MADRAAEPRLRVRRRHVGSVDLGLDDRVDVAVIRREWAASEGPRTDAVAAVDVRRASVDGVASAEPGGLSVAAARQLASLLAAAAAAAERPETMPGGAPR